MFCHSSDAVRQCKSKSLQNDPFNLSSSEILEKASPSSIVSFFRELIFIHLFQMVKADTPDADNMNAIFEIISKTKSIYGRSSLKLDFFFKNFMDNFDELCFYMQPRDMTATNNRGSIIDSSSFFDIDAQDDSQDNNTGEEKELIEEAITAVEDMLLEAAIYVIAFQQSRSKDYNVAKSNTFAVTNRKAYGASKIDHMKAEAETEDETRVLQYFDDDDDENRSITSNYSAKSRKESNDEESIMHLSSSFETSDKYNSRYIKSKNPHITNGSDTPIKNAIGVIQDRLKKNSLTKNVVNFSQVAVAPCVAPVFAAKNIFRKGRSPIEEQEDDIPQVSHSFYVYQDYQCYSVLVLSHLSIIFSRVLKDSFTLVGLTLMTKLKL